MQKVALIVGIDDYPAAPLAGCVNDAQRFRASLACNGNGTINFSCHSLLSSQQQITRPVLRENLEKLFAFQGDVALLFFAGHGYLSGLGGYLVTQDMRRYDEGISMTDVLALASRSKCREVVIILDCCHSGALGQVSTLPADQALLREGLSLLCASRTEESAVEFEGSGLFTSLVCEALDGGAASLTGEVTTASVYAFVDRNMGPWQQRPLFKANLSRLEVLRSCEPLVEVSALRELPQYFKHAEELVAFELSPKAEGGDAKQKQLRLSHFLAYRNAGLLKTPAHGPLGHDRPVLLTSLGRYYWEVAKKRLI
jgi:hypothetical protein